MRIHLLAVLALAGAAMPAAAQDTRQAEQRINKLESQMRSLQRKVFPQGAGATVQPEIVDQVRSTSQSGLPASSATADLNARLDALERQLSSLTGQAEENSHRLRQLETALGDTRARLDAAERPAPATEPTETSSAAAAAEPASVSTFTTPGDPAEEAYLNGYRLWNAGKFAEAQQALEPFAKQYPNHARSSYAQNLAGRAYLDGGKPATAAKILLANYQANPKGERAADSLYFLGQALVALKKPQDACRVYDELQEVYPDMRAWVKDRLPKARSEAKCTGGLASR